MSSVPRENDPAQAVPVYTVYPGNQWDMNYGSYQNNAQAPPPKYEDVINGRQSEYLTRSEVVGAHEVSHQAGVVLITPVYKYSKIQKIIGAIFTFVLIITFVPFIVNFLRF